MGDAAQFDRGVDGEREAAGEFDFRAQHTDVLEHAVVEGQHAVERAAAPEMEKPCAKAGEADAAVAVLYVSSGGVTA